MIATGDSLGGGAIRLGAHTILFSMLMIFRYIHMGGHSRRHAGDGRDA